MKLSEYAKVLGITYRTAFNHFHSGVILGSYQLKNGTIVVPDDYFKRKLELERDNRIEEKLDLLLELFKRKFSDV